MDKFIDYINNHSIEETVNAIIAKGSDKKKAIQDIRKCRTDFQRKTQELQWELERLINGYRKYTVGQKLIANEKCLDNFKKDEEVEVTEVDGIMVKLNEFIFINEDNVRKLFRVKDGVFDGF